jgi:hypothetical protein
VYQILSRFSDIHSDVEMRQKFEIFRHVVFDYGGDYYVAVPLDAPWNRNPREQQELLAEAHLLSNLFSSFEKEKIFKRVYSPLLSTGAIQKKLGRQGSKFTHCKAFRIYRFADGAWSEIILGAVMGAAKRVESEKRKRALRDEVAASTRGPSTGDLVGAFRDVGRQVGGHDDASDFLPPQPTPPRPLRPVRNTPFATSGAPGQGPVIRPANDQTANPRGPGAGPAWPQATNQPRPAPADPAAAFGPYAQYQPGMRPQSSELRRDPDITRLADALARREADVTVINPVAAQPRLPENVVAMPLRQPAQAPGVDVELTRETIRYTLGPDQAQRLTTMLPTTEAVLPAALASLARRPISDPSLSDASATLLLAGGTDVTPADDFDADAASMAARLSRKEPTE